MSADLDWARLEAAVTRAAARLHDLATENQDLRAEVARLKAELLAAGREQPAVHSDRADEVRRTLERLEGELEALL